MVGTNAYTNEKHKFYDKEGMILRDTAWRRRQSG